MTMSESASPDAAPAGGDVIAVKLRRLDERSLLLVNRAFHWINERPFNH